MKYLLPAVLAVFAFAGLAGPSEARTRLQAAKPMNTETFVQKAAMSNEFEIQSSQLALQKVQNEKIRQFAQRMIDDHTKIADQLKQTLQQANLPVPATELGQESQALLTKLKDERGPTFERHYVMDQRNGHKKAVRIISSYAKTGENLALKQLAAKTLPIIREHLRLAEALPLERNLTAKR
jgi:putative membrane protein